MRPTVWDAVFVFGIWLTLTGLYFITWPLPIVALGLALVWVGMRKA